jgi:hypothetical protein
MSPTDETRRHAARETFHGRGLTEGQLDDAIAYAGIVHREIHREGTFRDKLTDVAHAYARSERFDALKGEEVLRDVYEGLFGEKMNATRVAISEREEHVRRASDPAIALHADQVEQIIQDGPTQPFYKALDQSAISLANKLGITQSGAKELMAQSYETQHGVTLYARGKEVEAAFHKPVREAEIAARKAEKLQTHSRSQSMA